MSEEKQPKVNILLATYNGEKFIKKQLQSISEQSYENISVYIRDDGSSDNTLYIIKDFIDNNKTKKTFKIIENNGINLKCPASFYEITKNCETADYYSWCDQDDLWYPDKIKCAIEKLEQENSEQVLVYYSACDYQDEFGNVIRKSPEQPQNIKLNNILYYTPGSGFTMLFNEKARQELILNVNLGSELHDRWLLRGGVCFGKVLYEKKSTAAHIRHSQAVTAEDSTNTNLIKHIIKNEILGDILKKQKNDLKYFYNIYIDELSTDDKKCIELFCSSNTLFRQIKKIFYPKRLRTRIMGEIILRIYFIMWLI